jgi:2',3'-cyclic-nucleotide 2'-phosphodiesterase (5'-nucleotidase family)
MKMSDEIQAQIDELKEKLEAAERSNQGLKADLAKAKAKAKGADIDPELHAELQTKVEELTGQLNKVTKESSKQIEGLTKQLSEKDGALSQYLIDAQLSDNLAKAGVLPQFIDAAKSLLKSQATIKNADGKYEALIGDKPIPDAIKEWSAGDQGKHFVKAPDNSGGGAGGSGNGGGTTQKEMTRDAFQGLPQEKKVELSKAGVKIID